MPCHVENYIFGCITPRLHYIMLSCYPWSHPAQSQPSLPNSLPTFSLPYRTNLEILPKLVLSHLVTNPILPIFFPSPSVGNFAHTGLEPTTLHPFLPFFFESWEVKVLSHFEPTCS